MGLIAGPTFSAVMREALARGNHATGSVDHVDLRRGIVTVIRHVLRKRLTQLP